MVHSWDSNISVTPVTSSKARNKQVSGHAGLTRRHLCDSQPPFSIYSAYINIRLQRKMSGIFNSELCMFLVRKAEHIIFAIERIRMLALREFDVNCARKLDDFVILPLKDDSWADRRGQHSLSVSTLESFSLLYLIYPFSFAIILLIFLSLPHAQTRSFFFPPLCVVDTFFHFFPLSVNCSLGLEHSSV